MSLFILINLIHFHRSIGKRNFIFSAPGLFLFSLKLSSFLNYFVCFLASAGKTIVSELLLIKSVLETKRKALFIEPYVSIVQEKATYFRVSFYSSLHEIHWD